jgi:hypothetical protein
LTAATPARVRRASSACALRSNEGRILFNRELDGLRGDFDGKLDGAGRELGLHERLAAARINAGPNQKLLNDLPLRSHAPTTITATAIARPARLVPGGMPKVRGPRAFPGVWRRGPPRAGS